MKVICSYCREDMGQSPPLEDDSVSHGMCPPCSDYYTEQWSGLSLGEYLDRFELPVLVVDPDGRTLAANQIMSDALHKSEREIFGLLGGEVMECAHARLPGGCGKTVHCSICTIRKAVMHTMTTGEPCKHVTAYLERSDGRQRLVISSSLHDGVVFLELHSMEADLAA